MPWHVQYESINESYLSQINHKYQSQYGFNYMIKFFKSKVEMAELREP
jgi:hypothetical protein